MPEVVLLFIGLAVAGAAVLWPLRTSPQRQPADDGTEAAAVRYRVALEALRDVEADRRAGSLDDAAYAEQLADAEERAAAARAALGTSPAPLPRLPYPRGPRVAQVAASLIGIALLAGWFVPEAGIANGTVVNESLAAAQEAEIARQDRIGQLREALVQDPTDPDTLSELADAHLAGSSHDDLVRAAVALQLLIEVDPERADAYERIVTAYIRADDYANARAALDAYAEIESPSPVELAFLDGLIALRGENDARRALAAFDEFLSRAPDDPRASMVRELREEAARSGP